MSVIPDLKALGYAVCTKGSLTLIYRSSLPDLPQTVGIHGPLGALTSMKGRCEIRFIEPDMVVRTLTHGGLFRHVTGRRFLSPHRTIRELKTSNYLSSQGIPTPEILAVRLIRKGPFHYIDVVSRLVPDSVDLLVYFEKDRQGGVELFRKAGMLIRQMHDLGVYHADLHIKNLLLDNAGRLWMLDLDKAFRFSILPGFMKRMNLKRFMRSVEKWLKKGRVSIPDTWRENLSDGYGTMPE